jgi:hypothetical protein
MCICVCVNAAAAAVYHCVYVCIKLYRSGDQCDLISLHSINECHEGLVAILITRAPCALHAPRSVLLSVSCVCVYLHAV